MKSLKFLGVTMVIGLLIAAAFWWATTEMKDRNDPLNQADAFVHSDNGMLSWFDLKSRKGKLEGNLHEQKLIEEIGKPPSIEEKIYPLTGEATEKGYQFKVKKGNEIIILDAWFSGPHLSVKKHGEQDNILYNPVDQEEYDEYLHSLLNYHAEEKENTRLKKFFSDLRQVYGYLHTSENGSYQLFIKIDEALLEGELTGSLLMMADTEDKNYPYGETRYVLNGITDGLMLEFYTALDNKEVKMTGNFHEGTKSFDLTFWTTDERLTFNAVTEDEFKQRYDEFKTKAKIH